jgi:hypothetical protein
MQALRFQQTVQRSGEIHLANLPVVKGQQVELLLLFSPPARRKKRLTARQLLNSGLIGLWQGRTDITDSMMYARQLREQAQSRHQ